jgi:putative membrane protein insertion efficiency factor
VPAIVLIGLVRGYRLLLKPWLGNACRFEPTCSAYALQALERHGAAAGSYLSARRLARCHPWCPGGIDPVPETAPRLFTRLFRRASGTAAAADGSPAAASDEVGNGPSFLEKTRT